MVKQILIFLRQQWQRRWPWRSVPQLTALIVTSADREEARRLASEHARNISETGRFYFRENILDKLDEYFDYIKRMRKHDYRAYAIYSKIGAAIISEKTLLWLDELPASWRAGARPSFGAFTYLGTPDGEKIHFKFAYFHKEKKPPAWVQRVRGGDNYEMTLFYSVKDKPPITAPLKFHVHVDDKCNISLLLYHTDAGNWVNGRRKHGLSGKYRIPNRCWELPRQLVELCQEDPKHRDPHEIAQEVFTFTATTQENVASDIRISASKDNATAVFGIDLQRTPYFFKDRDVTVNIHGSRKRIFHVVRPHERHHADGRVTVVKNHFRGERNFMWNGYKVWITLPGRHTLDIMRFDAGSYDTTYSKPNETLISPVRLGQKLKQHLEQ